MNGNGHIPDDEKDDVPSPSITAPRLALRNFTSQWFLIPQGTGILAVILHNLDYQFRGLAIISQILWVLTIVLLVFFLALYGARVALYPSFVGQKLRLSIMETACLSSISIAFTTIIQMIALNLVGDWSPEWGLVAYGLWWVNVVMATAACIGITYVFTKYEPPGVDSVSMVILLPPIAALTAAAGGAVVCRYGNLDASLQVPVIIVSYLLVGLGLPLSLVSDALFVCRVYNGSWPPRDQVYSLMILCGPLGQSSFALLALGDVVSRGAFAAYNTSPFLSAAGGQSVAITSQLTGIITWGFGTFWHGYACIAVAHALIHEPKALLRWDQQLSSWSLVFPWVRMLLFRAPVFLLSFNGLRTPHTLMLYTIGSLHQCGCRARGHSRLKSLQCMVHRSGADVVNTVAAQHGFHFERAVSREDSGPRSWLARDV